MNAPAYNQRRDEIEEYFDRTAAKAWERLTSDAPVSGVRATVRAGRDRMLATLLSYLPEDLTGQRVLDAGCGTGALAVEAAHRGAEVVAVDISPTLVQLANERAIDAGRGRIEFRVGDMCGEDADGDFDWVVAMDSVIHYDADDMVRVIERLAQRARRGVAFTFAPSTALLQVAKVVGKVFPRGDRSPDIAPISPANLRKRIDASEALADFELGRTDLVDSGFYVSRAQELILR